MLRDNYKIRRQAVVEESVETEIALDDCGGHVMLSLKCGDDKFCQALSARDVGKLLMVMTGCIGNEVVCCEGDLVGRASDDHSALELEWNTEGHDCGVRLDMPELLVFEEACKSYCRQLMRANKGV